MQSFLLKKKPERKPWPETVSFQQFEQLDISVAVITLFTDDSVNYDALVAIHLGENGFPLMLPYLYQSDEEPEDFAYDIANMIDGFSTIVHPKVAIFDKYGEMIREFDLSDLNEVGETDDE